MRLFYLIVLLFSTTSTAEVLYLKAANCKELPNSQIVKIQTVVHDKRATDRILRKKAQTRVLEKIYTALPSYPQGLMLLSHRFVDRASLDPTKMRVNVHL